MALLVWRAAVMLGLLGVSGCFFPYRELQRPRIDGLLIDGSQKPVVGARITACTVYSWRTVCTPRLETVTDAKGRFRVPSLRQWHLWLPMEMPLRAYTFVSACANEQLLALEGVPTRESHVRLTLTAAQINPALLHAPQIGDLCRMADRQ
jgi:hypothetical protein